MIAWHWARFAGPWSLILLLSVSTATADTDLMQRAPWAACEYCHGADGRIDSAEVPALAGQSASYIAKQLADFRAGRRVSPDGQMRSALFLLDAADDTMVAVHFASRSPLYESPPVDPGRNDSSGAMLFWQGGDGVMACATCHVGEAGVPPGADPSLFGLNPAYLARQLKAFRDGRRTNDPRGVMRVQAATLDDAQVTAIASYLASLRQQ